MELIRHLPLRSPRPSIRSLAAFGSSQSGWAGFLRGRTRSAIVHLASAPLRLGFSTVPTNLFPLCVEERGAAPVSVAPAPPPLQQPTANSRQQPSSRRAPLRSAPAEISEQPTAQNQQPSLTLVFAQVAAPLASLGGSVSRSAPDCPNSRCSPLFLGARPCVSTPLCLSQVLNHGVSHRPGSASSGQSPNGLQPSSGTGLCFAPGKAPAPVSAPCQPPPSVQRGSQPNGWPSAGLLLAYRLPSAGNRLAPRWNRPTHGWPPAGLLLAKRWPNAGVPAGLLLAKRRELD